METMKVVYGVLSTNGKKFAMVESTTLGQEGKILQ
jgi:hypothetical protein